MLVKTKKGITICTLFDNETITLDDSLELSFRSINKILKVARTIADINGNELITKNDLLKSLNFRRR
nr:hypothetical protein [Aliarcobacter cibarius]